MDNLHVSQLRAAGTLLESLAENLVLVESLGLDAGPAGARVWVTLAGACGECDGALLAGPTDMLRLIAHSRQTGHGRRDGKPAGPLATGSAELRAAQAVVGAALVPGDRSARGL